ncbi:MAG: acylphosphatase [Patescibacteria group bacterium]|nr:acylphosphatase [Patescibacteria group bacterium]MDD5294747.1 acylphosphatase [Patescibacteria group bacterium]MDD5554894.1 acylphosphatase [Patescibacteria group bacterium]
MKKHLDIKIYGEVQGVSFRYYSLEKAKELELTGFTRNKPDGKVYIEVEGEEKSLDNFLGWCRRGPSWARVEKIEVKEGRIKNYKNFEVRY